MSIRQQRDFLRIWTGQVISNIGDGVHRIAILWWARQATGSDTVVVLVGLATVVPLLLAAPVAGALVDRFPRRSLMIASDAVRLATSTALAMLAATGTLTTPALLGLAAVAAAASAVFDPALLASVTVLVPDEQLAVANSMIGGAGAVAGILGPAAGGLLIGGLGTGVALWVDAATFGASIVLLAASRIPAPVTPAAASGGEGTWAGWHLVRRDRSIRDLVVVAACLNLCVAPVGVLVVGLAAGPLQLGGRGFGLLEACIPAGVLAGLAAAPRFARHRAAGLLATVLTGAALAVVGAVVWAPWAAMALLIAGVGVGVVNTLLPTRFQRAVDQAVQGRVFALVGALGQAGRPLGLALSAPLVAGLGVRAGLAVSGLGLVATAVAGRRGLVLPGEPAVSPEPATSPANAVAEIAGCQA